MAGEVWLYNRDLEVTGIITDYASVVTTRKFFDVGEFAGKFSLGDFSALSAAKFLVVDDETEVYVVEYVREVTSPKDGSEPYVEVKGHDAVCMLGWRSLTAPLTYSGEYLLTAYTDVHVSTLEGNEIPKVLIGFADPTEAAGISVDVQLDAGPLDEATFKLLGPIFFSMRSRLSIETVVDIETGHETKTPFIRLEVYRSSESDALLGDLYGNGASSSYTVDESYWRNAALVVGEGGFTVGVDFTGGTEDRREIYVDASSVARTVDGVTLSDFDYRHLLASRGVEELAKYRRIECAEAELSVLVNTGDVSWYDSARWSASLMVTESKTTRENGEKSYSALLGEPPANLARKIRKYAR